WPLVTVGQGPRCCREIDLLGSITVAQEIVVQSGPGVADRMETTEPPARQELAGGILRRQGKKDGVSARMISLHDRAAALRATAVRAGNREADPRQVFDSTSAVVVQINPCPEPAACRRALMTRWHVASVLLILCVPPLRAAALTAGPPESAGGPPRLMLARYLPTQALAALDRRQAAFDELKTPEQVAAYQKRLRTEFLEHLGGLPERTPLNAR